MVATREPEEAPTGAGSGAGVPAGPPAVVGAPARALLSRAADLEARARTLLARHDASAAQVRDAWAAYREGLLRQELSRIPIDRVRDAAGGRLRTAPLEAAGFRTALDLLETTTERLDAVPQVGRRTAAQLVAAARQIAAAAAESVRPRIAVAPEDRLATRLVVSLHRHDEARRAVADVRADAEALAAQLGALVRAGRPARWWLRRLLAGPRRRAEAARALSLLQQWLAWADQVDLRRRLDAAAGRLDTVPAEPQLAWDDFGRRAADYYALLAAVARVPVDVPASEGFLPDDIVARIREQPLDDALLRASLRGYQAFGARYALVQRRVIIGDEMGLGKTVQAIAVMAHLVSAAVRAEVPIRILVVCPASVLVNWVREIGTHSRLGAFHVHGQHRAEHLARWTGEGGIAVTTFATLGRLGPPEAVPPRLLVVDEAHLVKNPQARRSRAVAAWAAAAERVLLLTGTPMENQVEEFRALVRHVRPGLADAVTELDGAAGPAAFRRAVAPVYLRRNADDVLTELPELVQVDEWEEFTEDDDAAYRSAVFSGNFMAMRRAAFAVADPRRCAKLARLDELVEEAHGNRLKVLVFSYFRDVLDTVTAALLAAGRPGVHGPLTGDMPPRRRQLVVDDFTRHDGPAVLVSQIEAGGVGLNLQAASVIVLCEPQLKPTLEAQAIARAHRMGQLRTVRVHRLLSPDSVDERMLELLQHKRYLFDAFARRSDVAELAPEAVDISEAELARQVISTERDRLAHEPAGPSP